MSLTPPLSLPCTLCPTGHSASTPLPPSRSHRQAGRTGTAVPASSRVRLAQADHGGPRDAVLDQRRGQGLDLPLPEQDHRGVRQGRLQAAGKISPVHR